MDSWIQDLIAQLGYLGIAALMFAETVFPPLPSEVIMPFAGMEAGRGVMALPGVIAAGTAGAMAGNIAWYLVARALGITRFDGLIERYGRWLTISRNDVDRGQRLFANGGALFVCVGRLVPTIRSIVSIPAGLLAMPFGQFVFWSLLGTTAWTSILAVAGSALGQGYGAVERFVGPISLGIIVLLVVAYVWRVATWRR
ncbi:MULTISPECIES: DedA family protein [Sphingomonadales]|jgi:membrane protein DedA with SNARE-associated domain|uniref:DedA family protein n=3 Tax=Pseudomonadati TaxID=3379134 RepID=A0A7Y7USB1_9SPHN|nr:MULTISPECIES: DedA family protein [Sphingomonas]MBI0533464.1 DedA family protein [Sphingomonas sp. TX0522]MBZ6383510.1 DedA family protein [Sphingomonas sanguinis]NNG51891.1 DedA family protein [Sphingomonas sanguinis]NVP32804.1 DedA family protein [Sphingomonas sanguinis]OAN65035.1 alkaline phosphatase [Sphingomonas sp. TDK1]